jgi:hypothetical protein
MYLDGKDKQVRALSSRVKEADKYHNDEVVPRANRIKAIQDWESQRIDWIGHWEQLSKLFPPATEAYVANLKMNADGSMSFAVRAKSRETIDQLQKVLECVEGYKVKSNRVATKTDPMQLGYDQESTMDVIVSPKAKADLSGPLPGRPSDDDPSQLKPRGDNGGDRRSRPSRRGEGG